MTTMCLVSLGVVLFLASHVTSTSVLDAINHGKGCRTGNNSSLSSYPPIPSKTLKFLQHQVPAIIAQRGEFFEFAAAWVVNSAIQDVDPDFDYFPHGPKGNNSPLLDPKIYVSPRPARNGQNYVVARENSVRDKPLESIFQEVRLFGVLKSYKNASGMLIYSYFSPSADHTWKLCKMKKMVKVPTLLTYSHPKKDFTVATAALRRCGIRSVEVLEKVVMSSVRSGTSTTGMPLPDIDYLFQGYNILYGNPIVNPMSGADPGIRIVPTFSAVYVPGTTTPDQKWDVPQGIYFVQTKSCLIEFNSDECRSSNSYMESLSNEVGVDSGFFGASFKASVDVQEKTENLHEAKYSYTKSEAICSFYKGTVFLDLPPPLSPQILATLKKCNDNPTDEQFEKFVDYFGTHFVNIGVMGSKFGTESKISTEKFESLRSQGINVGTAASYSGMFSAGYTQETDQQKEWRESFESSRESKISYTYGTHMPADQNPATWAAQTSDSPMPISLTLTSISELLTDNFVQDLEPAGIDYETLRPQLMDFLTRYCSRLVDAEKAKDCMPPTEFATDGPGMLKWIDTGPNVILQDMVNEHLMALVSGTTSGDWTLKILKDKTETYSKVIEQGNYVMDVTTCPNRNRFGVLHGNLMNWAYIQMYDVSDDGKTVTEGLQIKLQDFGVGPEDVFFNALSYYDEVHGFLLVKSAWPANFELLKIKDICLKDAWGVQPEVLINAGCETCNPWAAIHLGGNLFAVSSGFQYPKLDKPVLVMEVLQNNEFNVLQTIQPTQGLRFSDIYKDAATNTVVMTMSNYKAYGDTRIHAYRWNPEHKNLTFAANLLTEKTLLDLPEAGSISLIGDYIYFGESKTGRSYEYKFKYE